MEAVILSIIFGVIFGIFYLHYSTRNKERMALIEKGADASIFVKGKQHAAPIWKVLVLNVAFLFMGIGSGTLIGLGIQEGLGFYNDALFPGIIFLMAGVGLYVGFTQTRKLID